MYRFVRDLLSSAGTVALLAGLCSADTLSVGSFGGPNDLNLTGPFYLAGNVGSTSNAGDLTVGGANFLSVSQTFNDTGGKATVVTATGGDLDPFAALPVYTGGSASDNANLGTIMHSLTYNNNAVPMQVLVTGLTPNTPYEVQVLISENFWHQPTQREFGISVNGVTALPSDSDIIGLSYPGAAPGVNAWTNNPTRGVVVTDLFTAGPSQTTVSIQANFGTGSGDKNSFFNAFTVQALVPEPSSLTLLGLGALGFAWFARPRRR